MNPNPIYDQLTVETAQALLAERDDLVALMDTGLTQREASLRLFVDGGAE